MGLVREKSPAPSGIRTLDLSVMRLVVNRCVTTTVQLVNYVYTQDNVLYEVSAQMVESKLSKFSSKFVEGTN